MNPITVLSAVEQVAEHLRAEVLRGELSGKMPGVNPLVAELGVGHKTVNAALRMLENEGILVNQGRGAQRKIARKHYCDTPCKSTIHGSLSTTSSSEYKLGIGGCGTC